jgi:ATP-dependent helicase YprA (DUF1998 family)
MEEDHQKRKKSKKEKKEKRDREQQDEYDDENHLTTPSADIDEKLTQEQQLSDNNTIDDMNEDRELRRQKKAAKKARKEEKKRIKAMTLSSIQEESQHMETILSEIQPKSKKIKLNTNNFGSYSYYEENSEVQQMTEMDVTAYRAEQGVQVLPEKDSILFKPLKSFDYLNQSLGTSCPYVQEYFAKKSFRQPSAVQAQCWPPLLAGRDVIGIAMTGSGKTLAFLIPGMLMLYHHPLPAHVSQSRATSYPRMLIMAPTRELAMQSFQVIEEMKGVKGICLYGGSSKEQQIAQLRNGVDIVVATPGRLVDLIEGRAISLQCKRII